MAYTATRVVLSLHLIMDTNSIHTISILHDLFKYLPDGAVVVGGGGGADDGRDPGDILDEDAEDGKDPGDILEDTGEILEDPDDTGIIDPGDVRDTGDVRGLGFGFGAGALAL